MQDRTFAHGLIHMGNDHIFHFDFMVSDRHALPIRPHEFELHFRYFFASRAGL